MPQINLARQPQVVVLGGAYAGLSTALNLLRICSGTVPIECSGQGRGGGGGRGYGRGSSRGNSRGGLTTTSRMIRPPVPQILPMITILDPRDGFFHTVGTPLAHTSPNYLPKSWKTYNEFPELRGNNLSVIQGRVISTDPEARSITYIGGQDDTRLLQYDYLVIATGLQREWPTVPRAWTKAEFILDGEKFIHDVKKSENGIVVIGGGAVGIEMAAEIKHQYPSKTITLVHSRDELLSSESVPSEFKAKALELLKEGGVQVILGNRVVKEKKVKNLETAKEISEVVLTDGQTLSADIVVWAASTATPASKFLPPQALDANGYVEILLTAQLAPKIPNSMFHFAVGDIAAKKGTKLAAGAIRMGKVVANNIAQLLVEAENGRPLNGIEQNLSTIQPPSTTLKLVVGETAIAYTDRSGDVSWGKDLKQDIFGDDYALHRAWGALGLPQDV